MWGDQSEHGSSPKGSDLCTRRGSRVRVCAGTGTGWDSTTCGPVTRIPGTRPLYTRYTCT